MSASGLETLTGGHRRVPILVADDLVDELISLELVRRAPVFRGGVVETAIAVGANAATVVSLLQGPETVRALAQWISGRAHGGGDEISIAGRQGERIVQLRVNGTVPVDAVAAFLTQALRDDHAGPNSGQSD